MLWYYLESPEMYAVVGFQSQEVGARGQFAHVSPAGGKKYCRIADEGHAVGLGRITRYFNFVFSSYIHTFI
jgi:hypothetical protein